MKKPTAVEKLKNEDVADKYKQVLQDLGSNDEEEWRTFRQAVTEVAEEEVHEKKVGLSKELGKLLIREKVQNIECSRQKYCLRKKKLRMNIQI